MRNFSGGGIFASTFNGRSISNILSLDFHADSLYTDASKSGWGAALVRSGKVVQQSSGKWSCSESLQHINILELTAVKFGLLSLESFLSKEINVYSDNTSAISYINKYGGCHSAELNELSREIWFWCIDKGIDIKAIHVPGVENTLADDLSRNFNNNVEWSLNAEVFDSLCQVFGTLSIDLFASRLNHKLMSYVSWRPDPGAVYVDAFHMPWGGLFGYAFPPFSLLGRVLSKLEMHSATLIVVCPYWPSQPWFPHLCDLLVAHPVLLPSSRSLLSSPVDPRVCHPLLPSLKLVACLLSSDQCLHSSFQRQLQQSLQPAGAPLRPSHTGPYLTNGCVFARKEGLITARPL